LVNRYLQLIEPLSFDLKLALISAITDSLRTSKKSVDNKRELFLKLKGAWKDLPDTIENDIYDHRTLSDKDISFDK
ncbi:MAG: hypothetical protein AAF828_12695, partial [Bacteroidota bacterium]